MTHRLTASVEENPSPKKKAEESAAPQAQAQVLGSPAENRAGDAASLDGGRAVLLRMVAEVRSADDPRDEPAVGRL